MPTTLLQQLFSRPLVQRSFLPLILLVGGWFAYANWFYLDDAYIAFRYAWHFAQGHGLVWYPGSQVYGYTNFLFTLLIGLLMKTGLSAEAASSLLSLPAYLGVLILTYHMGGRWLGSHAAGVISSLALATHLTMNGYATSGLETSLQTFLILLAYHSIFLAIEQQEDARWRWLAGAFSMAAMLVRLDSAVLLAAPLACYALVRVHACLRKETSWPQFLLSGVQIAALPVLGLSLMFAFCHSMYGQLLPNSFYVKVHDEWQMANGLRYLMSFLFYQELMPFFLALLAFGFWASAKFSMRFHLPLLVLFAAMICWLAYLLYVGGDFMQFRFMVPLLPLMTLFLCAVIMRFAREDNRDFFALMLVAFLLYGNVVQRNYFTAERSTDATGIESFDLMKSHVMAKDISWLIAGQMLGKLFYSGSAQDVKIAVTAAGAISYGSKLPVMDMLGLNTRAVVDHAMPHMPGKPGHAIKASFDFILHEQVHLLVGHPNFLRYHDNRYTCLPINSVMVHHDVERPLIFIPMINNYYLPAFYLKPHPAIEALLQSGDMLTLEEIRGKINCDFIFPPPTYKNIL
ncbi:MAG: hypothetical protein SFW63_07910 [Alphaproteobacteria bacterium]|nr:hypothetical protein [Alphaproteobacteria bacterium]